MSRHKEAPFVGVRVLVTGAAGALGRLLALRFARLGADLILLDSDVAGMEAVAAEVRLQPGAAHTYACDLTRVEEIAAVTDQVLSRHGSVEVLVHNAGVVSGGTLLELSDEDITRTFGVNALALYRLTKALLPKMIEVGRGHVVTIASAGGFVGSPRLSDYTASKHAAVAFDESLRMEARREGWPIRTTVVCPYYISAPMFTGVKTRFSALLPILDPEYVADRIVRAVVKRRRRVVLPRFVYLVFPLRLLPIPLFDALARFFGIASAMEDFKRSEWRESRQE